MRTTKRILILLLILILSLPVSAEEFYDGLYVYYLDVGEGDATILLYEDKVLMIDGGDSGHSSFVYSYLQNTLSIDKIDIIIATHSHNDHIGGIPAVLKACTVDAIYTPELADINDAWNDVCKYANNQGTLLIKVGVDGEKISWGNLEISIYNPSVNSKDPNDHSLVTRIEYGATSFLFPGDAGEAEEKILLSMGIELQADVLHIAHHGSKDNTGIDFLKHVNPMYGIISVGAKNRYGHPDDKLLERLQNSNVEFWRTDQSGTICCFSDGSNISFEENVD